MTRLHGQSLRSASMYRISLSAMMLCLIPCSGVACRIGLRVFRGLVALACLCAPLHCRAAVTVVLSDSVGPYAEFVEALEVERRSQPRLSMNVIHRSGFDAARYGQSDVLVAVGPEAVRQIARAETRAGVLAVMVPRAVVDAIASVSDVRRWSAIYLDQPPARQLDLVRLVLPQAERIGMLVEQSSGRSLERMSAAAAERRMSLQIERMERSADLYPLLSTLLARSDVLVATPDPLIYNASTLRNLLLASYRHRIPVLGLSPAYARAGAMFALYSTPAQLARQSLEWVLAAGEGRPSSANQYPRYFRVELNTHVARSLGVQLEDAALLQDRLERLERQP